MFIGGLLLLDVVLIGLAALVAAWDGPAVDAVEAAAAVGGAAALS